MRGCGCETGLLRFLPTPYGKIFYAACCIHDDDYERGGDRHDRKEADKRLFSNCMNTLIHSQTSNPGKCAWLSIVSLMYYYSVRIMGYRYFKFRN